VKTDPGEAADQAGNIARIFHSEIRTCPTCDTDFRASGASGLCPVCMLRRAIGEESATTAEPGSAPDLATASAEEADVGSRVRRFENYEVILDDDGRPIELGRGAMGVTYKALDVDLRRPVTLKVISERYLGDESARLCFLREARAAAGVRHPNVASAIVLRNSYLAGLSTGRAPARRLRPQMNSLTLLSLGLEIQIHGSGRRGGKAKDWRSWSPIIEPYWFWMVWSRFKIRLVRKRDAYVSLPSKRFCASLLPSTEGFA
jgi:hypothetical protein